MGVDKIPAEVVKGGGKNMIYALTEIRNGI